MGGTSTSSQTQASTTAPWTAAQPDLTSILGTLSPLISGSGVTPQEQSDVNTIGTNASNANTYAPELNTYVQSLLGGGGATAQSPAVQTALTNYTNQMSPLANNTNYDPMQTPGFANNLNQIGTDVTNQVNSQFAAAGRSGSGMNQQDLARGIAAGEAPVIANQYNANVANQQGAANSLLSGSNQSNTLLAGMNQQGVANQGTGVAAIPTAQAAPSYGASTNLALQQLLQQLPAQNLGLLAQIGIPIAGLGSQSTGQSSGQNTASGAQQFAQIAGGIGSLGNLLGPGKL